MAETNARLEHELDEHRRAREELVEARSTLQSLSRRLIRTGEDERRRIARDLHDQTGQSLSMLMQNLRLLRVGPDPRRLDESVLLTEDMIRQVRDVSMQLRPPMLDDLGLDAALDWLAKRHAVASGWQTVLEIEEGLEIPEDLRTEAFRIAQEAMTNASKHARASTLRVVLRASAGELELIVEDDGKGFDAEQLRSAQARARHFGFVSMAERAELVGGQVEIRPREPHGTVVHAVFPLRQEAGAPFPLVAL